MPTTKKGRFTEVDCFGSVMRRYFVPVNNNSPRKLIKIQAFRKTKPLVHYPKENQTISHIQDRKTFHYSMKSQ